jgi:hypothetical protein
LIANPNLYRNNATPDVAGPSTSPPPVGTAPFSMFYKPLELDELKVLREKRIQQIMEIDTPNRDEEEALEGCPVCLVDLFELDDNYQLDADTTVVQLNRCVHK